MVLLWAKCDAGILEYGTREYGICDALLNWQLVSSMKLWLYNMDAANAIINGVANPWGLWK